MEYKTRKEIEGKKILHETAIKAGEEYWIPVPRWVGGFDEQMYVMEIAQQDIPAGVVFKPYIVHPMPTL